MRTVKRIALYIGVFAAAVLLMLISVTLATVVNVTISRKEER